MITHIIIEQNAITTPTTFTTSGWPFNALCISGIIFCKNHPTPAIKVHNYVYHQNFPQSNSHILKKLSVKRGLKKNYSHDMKPKYIITWTSDCCFDA